MSKLLSWRTPLAGYPPGWLTPLAGYPPPPCHGWLRRSAFALTKRTWFFLFFWGGKKAETEKLFLPWCLCYSVTAVHQLQLNISLHGTPARVHVTEVDENPKEVSF